MFDRFFQDEPTDDPGVKFGRAAGTILAASVWFVMLWAAIR
jgi:hypothetical protein